MQNVTIYSTPTCHFCHMAKEFFKENNIAYTEYDVAGGMEKRKEMVDKSGELGVPVIQIDNNIIIGFNKDKLAKKRGQRGLRIIKKKNNFITVFNKPNLAKRLGVVFKPPLASALPWTRRGVI